MAIEGYRDYGRVDERSEVFWGGVIAGVIGGCVLALIMMIVSAGYGLGFWSPMRQAAGLWAGVQALVDGGGIVILGILTWLAACAIGGVVFANLVSRQASGAGAVEGGIVYGFFFWLVSTFILLPILDPTMRQRIAMTPWWWFIGNLVFGAVLGLTPGIRRALGRSATSLRMTPAV